MELVEVTAKFAQDGTITPLRLAWQGVAYPIESTGRRWQEQDGLHILIMVPGERVLELIFQAEKGLWYLKRLPSSRSLA